MNHYRDNFDPSFSWDQLDHKTLARFGREIMLGNQIHDRSLMPQVGEFAGMKGMTTVAIDEWMGASPIYNARNRSLHNIQGDGVDVIMKGFQLDIGAPHMWLKFHYDVRDHDYGQFWLTSCGAYNHVRAMTGGDVETETQICVHMEDPTFDATVMAVNRGARCVPVFRPPHGEVPEEGPCRWEVVIEDRPGLVEENEITDKVRQSRAAQFSFSPVPTADDGLADYSGPFKRDFRLEDLCSGILLQQIREFALNIHLLQRACYLGIERHFGHQRLDSLLSGHCAAMAPLYQGRLRKLFGIEGDDMAAVLKLLQLDWHLVPEYTDFRFELVDETTGIIRLYDCEALGDGDLAGVLTDMLNGGCNGLRQIVQSANPRAQLEAIAPDSGERFAWRVRIDPAAEPAVPSDYAALAGMNGLTELDLSEHVYHYPD